MFPLQLNRKRRLYVKVAFSLTLLCGLLMQLATIVYHHQPRSLMRPTTSETNDLQQLPKNVQRKPFVRQDEENIQALSRTPCYRKNREPLGYTPYVSASELPRTHSMKEYKLMMKLLNATRLLLLKENIVPVMFYESLVGSYLMHDLLPWDGGMVLVVNKDAVGKLDALVQRLNADRSFELAVVTGGAGLSNEYRVHFKDGRRILGSHSTWPFVLIILYSVTDETVTIHNAPKMEVRKDQWYPLHYRPLGRLWLPSPKTPRVLLTRRYGVFQCREALLDTKHGRPRKRRKETDCSLLKDKYPFVHRVIDTSADCVTETLKLGNMTLHTVYTDEAPSLFQF